MRVLIICFTFMVSACSWTNYSYPLEDYYFDLKSIIPLTDIQKFKSQNIHSVDVSDSELQSYVLELTRSRLYKEDLKLFFASKNIAQISDAKISYIIYTFHYYLNNEKINEPFVLELVEKHVDDVRSKITARNKMIELKSEEIVKSNCKQLELGDTLNIVLPIFDNEGKKTTRFVSYPHSFDYSSFSDSILIQGIVVKIPFREEGLVDFLDMRIIGLSHKDVKLNFEELKLDSTYKFHISAYHRPLFTAN